MLVTQASAGFVTSVAELVIGFLVDLSRGITRSAHRVPTQAACRTATMGRELKGSTLGVIGYGAIGREVVRIGQALGMRVLVNDPYSGGRAGAARRAARANPTTSCRSPSPPPRPRT